MAIGRIPEPGTGIPESIIAAKGDILVGTANDTPAVLSVGTDTYTLVANSSTSTGLEWVAPAGGGKVLQVVAGTTSTYTAASSTTFIDTTLTATITPTSATSQILVMFSQNGCGKTGNTHMYHRLVRGGTTIADTERIGAYNGAAQDNYIGSISSHYLDSPATTSATTYKTQFAARFNSTTVQVQLNDGGVDPLSTMILMEIGA